MATLTNQEIERLKQQLKEKQEEIRVIYDKLVEAGVMEMPDDALDQVAGGGYYINGRLVTGIPDHTPYPTNIIPNR